ncbi:MAG: ATP-binding protein [Hyphomonadaceae bacterium]|nr:ATP-binding protein [Hyphomonadaceae bacterium]
MQPDRGRFAAETRFVFPGGGGADYIGVARQFNPSREAGGVERPMDPHPDHLARIAAALDRLAPPPLRVDLGSADCFHWSSADNDLRPVPAPARTPLHLLAGMDMQKERLLANTRRFAAGARANNALLWGARGTGKSALVKAVHAAVCAERPGLKLVEASGAAMGHMERLIGALRAQAHPVVLFLDDVSFAGGEDALKALKPALDGGVDAASGRLIVYATSNRRQLVARDARENTPDDLLWADAAEEKLALADRFGLWLGFHAMDQSQYLAIVHAYAQHFALPIAAPDLEREALLWLRTRGARSGRTAYQFIIDLGGRFDIDVSF